MLSRIQKNILHFLASFSKKNKHPEINRKMCALSKMCRKTKWKLVFNSLTKHDFGCRLFSGHSIDICSLLDTFRPNRQWNLSMAAKTKTKTNKLIDRKISISMYGSEHNEFGSAVLLVAALKIFKDYVPSV